MQAICRLIPSVLILHLIVACSSSPFEQESYQAFIRDSIIEPAQFKHRIQYLAQADNTSIAQDEKHGRKLSIFIEGDGTPWFREKYVSKDPSPRNLLMYKAMQDLEGSRLYLGRPCYFQTQDPNCHYRYWTSHRYSPEVVKSMQDVLEPYLQDYAEIVYIGHSGGGTLATLLACAEPAAHIRSRTLITLSANLDTDNWTDHHGWSRMQGSINPAVSLTRCPDLTQYHYVGEMDENVPYFLNQRFFDKQDSVPILYKETGHADWLAVWPDIIRNNPALKASTPP